ncbi:Protein preY, mitochondrial [Phytophthora cinnamomi]|uniref:Protein preY, mitochondrial n=1 Tax=Phytophthora cinnamomi TaxID=4785 RepID=UPI00355AAE82|nr:Protein preY, mitochondrial [Phytophthora cinnamomi]KAG6597945.1 Protein preY, mitochondrial [Phytophthora cinnamomi]
MIRNVLRPALRRAPAAQLGVRSMSSETSRFDRAAKLEDESVMQHLVCPISKYPLRYDAERGSLVCDEINVEYPIWRGVPLLVPSEGRIIGSSNGGDHE